MSKLEQLLQPMVIEMAKPSIPDRKPHKRDIPDVTYPKPERIITPARTPLVEPVPAR